MAWRSCGPEILNPALFHELTAGKAMTCPSFVLISGSPYLPHDASSSWAPKDPGNCLKTYVDSDQTGRKEGVIFYYLGQVEETMNTFVCLSPKNIIVYFTQY